MSGVIRTTDGDTNKTKWVTYGAAGYYTIGSFDGKYLPLNLVNSDMWMESLCSSISENIPSEDGRQIQVVWATISSRHAFQYDDGIPNRAYKGNSKWNRLFNEPISEIEILHKNIRKYKNMTWEET